MSLNIIANWVMLVAALASLIIQILRPKLEGRMWWVGIFVALTLLGVSGRNLMIADWHVGGAVGDAAAIAASQGAAPGDN